MNEILFLQTEDLSLVHDVSLPHSASQVPVLLGCWIPCSTWTLQPLMVMNISSLFVTEASVPGELRTQLSDSP
jgi:hypothetical protein